MNAQNLKPIRERENRQLKQYLGDGVYVCIDNATGQIELTTEDGVDVTNVIYLDLNVANAFLTWLNNIRDMSQKEMEERQKQVPPTDNPEEN